LIKAQEIKNITSRLGISNNQIIEKDYVLGHVLNAIYGVPLLSKSLVFKGGTSLRKCWFENYRFSEDLDFTLVDNKLSDAVILKNELTKIKSILSEIGFVIGDIEIEQIKDEYNEEAFTAKIPFTAVYKSPPILPKIKVDITRYEKVLLPVKPKFIIHPYSDNGIISASVISYSLEEILAEKLRTIIQRGYPRDFYDAFSVLIKMPLDNSPVYTTFLEKCKFKNVGYNSTADFFTEIKLTNCRIAWKNSLGHLIKELQDFDYVITKLKELLKIIFK